MFWRRYRHIKSLFMDELRGNRPGPRGAERKQAHRTAHNLMPHIHDQGIETVRRDGCPLLVKMLEKVLRILFTTKDLSQVKGYLYRQWTRILTDRAAVGDFIFAKEVKWEL